MWRGRFIRRETFLLLVLLLIAVVAFGFTQMVAQKTREVRLGDAAAWHERARHELESDRPAEAAQALRRAVAAYPESRRYQLDLADALAAAGRDDQARQVLVPLRDRQPEAADVNLALARLESRHGDVAAAVRYYQHALAGLWSDQHIEERRQIRFELAEFLLRHGQRRRALAELLVLSPTLPGDPSTRARLGRMFLEVGESSRALEQFTAALEVAPDHDEALAGAGEAAFEMGEYPRARRYLERAPDSTPGVNELKTVIELVLTRDPLAPRIGAAERRRRLVANLGDVRQRLDACAERSTAGASSLDARLAELESFQTQAAAPRGLVPRDSAEEGLEVIVRALRAVEEICGPPTPLDRALLIIARRHEVGIS